MTGLAQCDEVIPVMGATLGERQLVMDFLGRNVLPFGKALLTQRMGGGIGITDAFPCSDSVSLQRGHGRTSRSVCFPVSHVPRRTYRP